MSAIRTRKINSFSEQNISFCRELEFIAVYVLYFKLVEFQFPIMFPLFRFLVKREREREKKEREREREREEERERRERE